MKFTYFNFYAKGEANRILLNHAGVEFEDNRLTFEDWGKIKGDSDKAPFSQLPVLEKDGKAYSQSLAILRYLGALNGYYSDDVEQRYIIDEFTDLSDDFLTPIIKGHFGPGTDEEK